VGYLPARNLFEAHTAGRKLEPLDFIADADEIQRGSDSQRYLVPDYFVVNNPDHMIDLCKRNARNGPLTVITARRFIHRSSFSAIWFPDSVTICYLVAVFQAR